MVPNAQNLSNGKQWHLIKVLLNGDAKPFYKDKREPIQDAMIMYVRP